MATLFIFSSSVYLALSALFSYHFNQDSINAFSVGLPLNFGINTADKILVAAGPAGSRRELIDLAMSSKSHSVSDGKF